MTLTFTITDTDGLHQAQFCDFILINDPIEAYLAGRDGKEFVFLVDWKRLQKNKQRVANSQPLRTRKLLTYRLKDADNHNHETKTPRLRSVRVCAMGQTPVEWFYHVSTGKLHGRDADNRDHYPMCPVIVEKRLLPRFIVNSTASKIREKCHESSFDCFIFMFCCCFMQ